MTYFDYFLMHDDEPMNMGWCKPYVDKSGDYTLIIHDGEAESAVTPKGTFHRYDGTLTDMVLEHIAHAVNDYYDDYFGWSNCHIALEAMTETNCINCPLRDECEAINEADESVHGQGWHITYRFHGFIRDWEKLNAYVVAYGEDPLFETEDDFKVALHDGTVRYLHGWTTIWTDGIY